MALPDRFFDKNWGTVERPSDFPELHRTPPVRLRGRVFSVELHTESDEWDDWPRGLRVMRERWLWLLQHEPEVRRKFAEPLYIGWDEGWRNDDEPEPSSAEEFVELIGIAGVELTPSGEIRLCFDDGNNNECLFGGHSFSITLGADNEFRNDGMMFG